MPLDSAHVKSLEAFSLTSFPSRARRCTTDGARPPVDLEDAALGQRLFRLFHGSPATSAAAGDAVEPASPAVRVRLMGLFSKSIAAANAFPANLQV